MKSVYERDPIRIPVKLVDGTWEYFYGGGLPIKNGAVGDLVVDKDAVEDKEFLARLKIVTKYKILESGTELLVALVLKPRAEIDGALLKNLLPTGQGAPMLGDAYYYTFRSPGTRFVKISIGKPTKQQWRADPNEKGGVWLVLEGMEPKGISTSTVVLPQGVSADPAISLNHAFTLLSEKYEPWRKSHTGNIYDRILYREMNGKWYPLSVLRNAAIASDEHQFIRDQWAQLAKKLSYLAANTEK